MFIDIVSASVDAACYVVCTTGAEAASQRRRKRKSQMLLKLKLIPIYGSTHLHTLIHSHARRVRPPLCNDDDPAHYRSDAGACASAAVSTYT